MVLPAKQNEETPVGLPLPRIWWIEAGSILGGPFPGTDRGTVNRETLQALLDLGIRVFVNLQQPGESGGGGSPFPDYEPALAELAGKIRQHVEVHHTPICDAGIPTIVEMRKILATLRQAADAGQPVYVHCWGGHGRTATVAGCWMIDQGKTPQEALAAIRRNRRADPYLARRASPQTSPQIMFVHEWAQQA